MAGPAGLLVVVHVVANLVWIGSILAVVVVLRADAPPRARGALGRAVYRTLAAPASGVSVLAGGARLALDARLYLEQTRFMHGKLFLALVVLALHHSIGDRARRLERGVATDADHAGALGLALAAAAAGAAYLALVKPL